MSGGRATVHGAGNVRQAGDITAVSSEGFDLTDRCYFECKFYKNLNIQLFILHGGGKLAAFWEETCKRAHEHNRHPVLVVKENNEVPLVIMLREFQGLLGLYTDDSLPHLNNCMGASCTVFKLSDILAQPYYVPRIKRRT
jgi:hypothetical protein